MRLFRRYDRCLPELHRKTLIMQLVSGKIRVEAKGAVNTFLPLTKSTVEVLIMAKEILSQICKRCNSTFETTNPARQFCSKSCATQSYNHSHKYKHGQAIGKDKPASPEYVAYMSAKTRCSNPNAADYARYGGRGIEFRFNSLQEFIDAIGKKPSPDYSVNRINNDGHYEVGNVEWATRIEQQQNTRANRRLSLNGETLTIGEWARRLGLSKNTINERLKRDWCMDCALSISDKTWGCRHREGRRVAKLITWQGESLSARQWEKRLGWPRNRVLSRVELGWTTEEIFREQVNG